MKIESISNLIKKTWYKIRLMSVKSIPSSGIFHFVLYQSESVILQKKIKYIKVSYFRFDCVLIVSFLSSANDNLILRAMFDLAASPSVKVLNTYSRLKILINIGYNPLK